ncbi:MAG: hypothetical protein OEM91_14525, partial [Hyphomicrobiales bacterium]|nr:hypothetical protein [Hyphomicrobiales bacterium]
RYEVFAYVLFMAVVFSIVGVISISGKLPHGDAPGVAIYAFFMVWAAAVFWYSKNQMAAAFCATAPVAVLLYFLIYGFHPKQTMIDKSLMIIFAVAWLYYSWRIVRIATLYPDMPDPPNQLPGGRRNPYDYWKRDD